MMALVGSQWRKASAAVNQQKNSKIQGMALMRRKPGNTGF